MYYTTAEMFPMGNDLPLFSGTTPNAHIDPFRNETPSARQVTITGIVCRTCLDTGRIGNRFCFCKAGDRASKREAQP